MLTHFLKQECLVREPQISLEICDEKRSNSLKSFIDIHLNIIVKIFNKIWSMCVFFVNTCFFLAG